MAIDSPIRQGRTLSVMPTWQCTAACTHCGTLSSPRSKVWLDQKIIMRAIDQAADAGYMVVVFTGGEPTLAGRGLLRAIERATGHGLVTRIVTNASWALNAGLAQRRVNTFVNSGLKEINFSTGDEHAKFVPIENVLRAARAAMRARMSTILIMLETQAKRSVTRETLIQHPLWKAMVDESGTSKPIINESPWMPLRPDKTARYRPGATVNALNLANRGGCTNVLTTTTLEADGRLAACCGLGMRTIPELQIGDAFTSTIAEADERAAQDFLKRWIRVEGPEHILAWAAMHDDRIKWEDMYAHHCQACARIYKDPLVREVIRDNFQEKIADVAFKEWLLYHYTGPDLDVERP